MHRFLSLVFVSAAVMTCAPCVVAAAVEPLLVVVENRPGSGVDPVEVRQAIAAELRTPVRAPRDAAADDTSDLLIVAVDHAEIRMSLRGNASDAPYCVQGNTLDINEVDGTTGFVATRS